MRFSSPARTGLFALTALLAPIGAHAQAPAPDEPVAITAEAPRTVLLPVLGWRVVLPPGGPSWRAVYDAPEEPGDRPADLLERTERNAPRLDLIVRAIDGVSECGAYLELLAQTPGGRRVTEAPYLPREWFPVALEQQEGQTTAHLCVASPQGLLTVALGYQGALTADDLRVLPPLLEALRAASNDATWSPTDPALLHGPQAMAAMVRHEYGPVPTAPVRHERIDVGLAVGGGTLLYTPAAASLMVQARFGLRPTPALGIGLRADVDVLAGLDGAQPFGAVRYLFGGYLALHLAPLLDLRRYDIVLTTGLHLEVLTPTDGTEGTLLYATVPLAATLLFPLGRHLALGPYAELLPHLPMSCTTPFGVICRRHEAFGELVAGLELHFRIGR